MTNYDDLNLYVNKVNKVTLQNKAKVNKNLEDIGFLKAFIITFPWTLLLIIFAVWVYR
ncbi:hypothetical protein CNEO_170082 [Clostridium neonatale]|uniref:hypothetical protein n=1 Tax=Clostridium neonatale TaxID=137838 RepID=UPI001D2CF2FE|nr:hypothetical protein [Clostridium neonatale]CAG9702668.1 hypothetical protein CNEO_170082 [Clostridium neonatale]